MWSWSAAVRDRIRRLAIPPAWTDVWIATSPHGHIQATGRDARGRKQYRYHPDFRAHKEGEKFDRTADFERAVDIEEDEVDEGEVVSCPECGTDFEIVTVNPLELKPVEELDEDEDEEEDEEAEDGDV